jgi:chemotaxis regulatin CheY-phosphate phosphatase CheZ
MTRKLRKIVVDFSLDNSFENDAINSLPKKYNYLIERWKKAAKKGKLEERLLKDIKKLKLIEQSVEVIKNIKTIKKGKIILEEKKVNLVEQLYKYVHNRIGQFNYLHFKKNKMPIGSGRIESANKILIKKR